MGELTVEDFGPTVKNETIDVPMPQMVFSIIGDSVDYVPTPWRKRVFQTALLGAASNVENSWIIIREKEDDAKIISGEKEDVAKIVTGAYEDYFCREYFDHKGKYRYDLKDVIHNWKRVKMDKLSIHLIRLKKGVGPKRVTFISKSSRKYYNEFELQDLPVDVEPQAGTCKENKFKLADLLKDSELQAKTCKEKKVAAFECAISKKQVSYFEEKEEFQSTEKDSVNQRMPVPVIVIVVGGDVETIEYAKSAVEGNIPILLVKGSGKAADLILKYMENVDAHGEEKDKEDIEDKISSLLFGVCKIQDKPDFKNLPENLKSLESRRHLISVFDVDNDDPLMLSKIIGEGIVRAWACQVIKGIPSATSYTPITVIGGTQNGKKCNGKQKKAKEENEKEEITYLNERLHVVDTTFLSPSSLPLSFYFGYQKLNAERKEDGKILLYNALKSNRRDYVQVLLDQSHTLDETDLRKLYKKAVECECKNDKKDECLHMPWIMRQYGAMHKPFWYHTKKTVDEDAHEVVKKILGYQDKNKFYVCCCCCVRSYEKCTICKGDQDKHEDTAEEKHDKMISSLLLWSIFANRPDLSQILWLASSNHLMTGLICSVLIKKLAKKANNVKMEVFSRSLTEHAKLFSDRCLELMTEMYDQNAKAAMKIVDTEVTIWGITSTPMTFAYENYEIDFVAHTCPQRRLNRIWYNKLAPDFVPFVKDLCSRPIEFFEAPLFRYLYHYILFLLMLIAFSAFVMTSVDDYYYRRPIARVWEYYIYIWAAGDLIEEIRNGLGIFITGGKTHRGYFSRAKRYLYDFWNAVDILSYLLLILALFTRHLWEPEPFTIARRMFSVSLLLMYLRYLQVFLMSRRLGPKLIMIKEMLKDLMYFLLIAFVVIIGVGIYYHANLYPNHINLAGEGNWDTWHIWKILYYPYWQLYGESFSEFLEDQEQSNCTSDRSMYEVSTDLERCAEKDPTVPIVSAIYMLISNLLLVNLVIAMFSYTFDAVTANAEKLWRFQKYVVITDYEEKIPSPFNLLLRLYQILKWAWKRFCCKGRCCFKTKEKNEEKDIKKESKRQFRLRFQKMIASEISSLKDTKL